MCVYTCQNATLLEIVCGGSNVKTGGQKNIHNFMLKNCLFGSMGRLQGLHRLEKYLNLEGFLGKSLKINSALKSTGKITQKP